jgi:hypothetical protein
MLDTEIAWLSGELSVLVQDARFELSAVLPLLLSLVSMVEHAKCLEKGSTTDSRLAVHPVASRAALRQAFKPDVVALEKIAAKPPAIEHGHSHGGVPCAGHAHGDGSDSGKSKDAALRGISVSHNGASQGHAHASSAEMHGHSHGGATCNHGHGSGAAPSGMPSRSKLCMDHPWGSPMRALLSVMPSPSEMQVAVYYSPLHFLAIKGNRFQITLVYAFFFYRR